MAAWQLRSLAPTRSIPLHCPCWRVPLCLVPWPPANKMVKNFHKGLQWLKRSALSRAILTKTLPPAIPSATHLLSTFHSLPPPPSLPPPLFLVIWTNRKIQQQPLSLSQLEAPSISSFLEIEGSKEMTTCLHLPLPLFLQLKKYTWPGSSHH